MDQQATYAGNIGRLRSVQQGVLEQRFAKAFALVILIDGKSGQNQHGHRMSGQPLYHPRRGRLGIDAADCKAVESNDVCLAADVGLCTVGLLIDECITLQELVQCWLATVEPIDQIRSAELSDWFISCTHPGNPASVSSFFRRGLAWTGRSSAS